MTLLSVVWFALGSTALGNAAVAQAERKHDPREEFAASMGLSAEQKAEFLKVKTAFDKKINPIRLKMWTIYKEESKALAGGLPEAQRAKVAAALKTMRNKGLDDVSAKLNLSAEQKDRLAKVCDDFAPKFGKLVGREGKEVHRGIQDLRAELIEQARSILNDEQRAKLSAALKTHPGMPSVIHDDAALSFVMITGGLAHFAQPRYIEGLAKGLDLTDEQKTQFARAAADIGPKIESLGKQLLGLEREEITAIERVLTEDQRTKWRALRKANGED